MMKLIDVKCVQCARLLKSKTGWNDTIYAFYCDYPDCPNYGLHQEGIQTPRASGVKVTRYSDKVESSGSSPEMPTKPAHADKG